MTHSAEFAVHLQQSAPTVWTWRVLDPEGGEAASGQSAHPDIAREEAEFFRRFLRRFERRQVRLPAGVQGNVKERGSSQCINLSCPACSLTSSAPCTTPSSALPGGNG